MNIKTQPGEVFREYNDGTSYKNGIGDKGIAEQAKVNERFYVGDQWHGAKCGNKRPLVRHNVIKRIGDYKMAVITSAPVAVNYSADGIPNTVDLSYKTDAERSNLAKGQELEEMNSSDEIALIMSAMSDYFRVTAERLKFDTIKDQALRNGYISGTSIIYTYWDDKVETGLYADEGHTAPIKGDIGISVIDVENVVFGDPNNDDVQQQPYIEISQRMNVDEVRREARRNHRPADEVEMIKPDGANTYYENSGERGEQEPIDSRRVTVITKLYKEWDESGNHYTVKAAKVTEKATIRAAWDLGIRLYPVAVMPWSSRRSCIYGDSDITYTIPNQIAINRALTAMVWNMMLTGMPKLAIDADKITGDITNDPGQIIRVFNGDPGSAIKYISPSQFEGSMQNVINDLIQNTLSQNGANDAALGSMNPDNASAIIALREASTMPMQTLQNRFYQFVEDNARIWADFWFNKYGDRSLKIEDSNGTWYMPFHGDKYRNLVVSVKVDVGASTLWGEAQTVATLDNMLEKGIINPQQYLDRLPNGLIPDKTGLLKDIRQKIMKEQSPDTDRILSGLSPEARQAYDNMPPEQQQQLLQEAMNGGMQQ